MLGYFITKIKQASFALTNLFDSLDLKAPDFYFSFVLLNWSFSDAKPCFLITLRFVFAYFDKKHLNSKQTFLLMSCFKATLNS